MKKLREQDKTWDLIIDSSECRQSAKEMVEELIQVAKDADMIAERKLIKDLEQTALKYSKIVDIVKRMGNNYQLMGYVEFRKLVEEVINNCW